MGALRISPTYTSLHWEALDSNNPHDWPTAAAIVRDRLDGRFLNFATWFLKFTDSGFVVLAIDSIIAETIQQFRAGITDGSGQSERLVKQFLEGSRFQPHFNATARKAFYQDIRCGLLHQAEAKRKWLIRRKQAALLQIVPSADGYIVDVERLHIAVLRSLDDYLAELLEPAKSKLRSHLWKKMNHICSVRTARGALYEAETSTTLLDPE